MFIASFYLVWLLGVQGGYQLMFIVILMIKQIHFKCYGSQYLILKQQSHSFYFFSCSDQLEYIKEFLPEMVYSPTCITSLCLTKQNSLLH